MLVEELAIVAADEGVINSDANALTRRRRRQRERRGRSIIAPMGKRMNKKREGEGSGGGQGGGPSSSDGILDSKHHTRPEEERRLTRSWKKGKEK